MKINNREKKAAIKSQILMILLVALFASLIRMIQKFYLRFAKRKEEKEV